VEGEAALQEVVAGVTAADMMLCNYVRDTMQNSKAFETMYRNRETYPTATTTYLRHCYWLRPEPTQMNQQTLSTARESGDAAVQTRPDHGLVPQRKRLRPSNDDAVADSGERGVVDLSTGESSSITTAAGVIREIKSGGDDEVVDICASKDTANSSDEDCQRASAAAASEGDACGDGASDDEASGDVASNAASDDGASDDVASGGDASDAAFGIPSDQPQETKADEASPHWFLENDASRTRP